MPSSARTALTRRLADVNELVSAHQALTGGGRGRPRKKQGAAITRAGIALLAAAMESFVEDLFEEALGLIFPGLAVDERKTILEQTSKRFNNASVFKTNLLFLNLGCPFLLSDVRWQKFSNNAFKRSLDKLVESRNQIAHGGQPAVRLAQLKKWMTMVTKYSEVLDRLLADRIQSSTLLRPDW